MAQRTGLLLLLAVNVCVMGRQIGRGLRESQDHSVLNFAVTVGSGAGAETRKSYVAHDTLTDAIYSVAQVEQGTVSLGGSSLTVKEAAGGPVQSIFVYRFKPGNMSETEWAVNLQATAKTPQSFFLTAAAASPTTGDLYLVGTYSGLLTLGNINLTSTGSFDMFVAAVSGADAQVLWANSFGGAVGSDTAYDVDFNPVTGEVLVSGAFSKNAVFGPDHAATASVNNVMQSQGVFVACMTGAEGAVSWVSSFPSDAEYISTVRLAVSDAIYLGAAGNGPFTVYANGSKLSIPTTGAGAVFVKLDFDGQLDASVPPATVMSVSNGVPTFTLSAMGASKGVVYIACTFVGKLLAGGTTVGQTADVYSNAAVIQMSGTLEPVWFTSLTGPGVQTADSLGVVPGNTSVFVSGNAWSTDGVSLVTGTPGGMVSNISLLAPEGSAQGAFLLQLGGSTGQEVWLRMFEGSQDQAPEVLYDALGQQPQLLLTGLFDRGSNCLALNSRDSQCATGVRPFFLAAIPVSPTNTAAVEEELGSQSPSGGGGGSGSSSSSLSGGAIAGIVVGSVVGAVAVAAAAVFVYKRRQQSLDVGSWSGSGSGAMGFTTAVVTTSATVKA